MRSRRLAFFSFLISLPTILLVSAGSFFVFTEIPRLQKVEPRRIGMVYRSLAEELADNEELAEYRGPRRKGWRQRGKIDGRPWGYVTQDGQSTIYLSKADGEFLARNVAEEREIDYVLIAAILGSIAAILLIGLTALAVFGFVRYWRERDDFLAAVAHDLTTPLVGMRRFIGQDDEIVKELNERMLRLVGNLKDFLKLGGKRREPEKMMFDLVKAYEEAYRLNAEDFRDLFDGEDVKKIGSEKSLIVEADETMTIQILWNLLTNDLKYAAPFGRIEAHFERDGVYADFKLVDFGPGMTRYQRHRAFDRYYRAQSAIKGGKGGFGIGLATAREFARAMGGDLTVEENRPSGCIFTLKLPLSGENMI